MASYKAVKGLGVDDYGILPSAFSTYAAGTVIPSVLSGAAGGWLASKRKEDEDEEDEEDA
jgi:hypothetical protein